MILAELVIITPPYFLQHNKVSLSSVQVGDSGITNVLVTSVQCLIIIWISLHRSLECVKQHGSSSETLDQSDPVFKKATLRLVCSLVMPRLDYGNISLYGISKGLLDKLQNAQNAAARLVVKCLRSDHITPHLSEPHWL